MTKYKEPQFPALFVDNSPQLRQFDKNLITVLGAQASNLKAILDNGISFEDNVDGVLVSFTSGAADAENTVPHLLGKIPTGFITYSVDKGAVVYKGTTAWTKTNIYLKVNVITVAAKVLIF